MPLIQVFFLLTPSGDGLLVLMLGADAGEEGLGELVCRVLRDELAREGTLEDRNGTTSIDVDLPLRPTAPASRGRKRLHPSQDLPPVDHPHGLPLSSFGWHECRVPEVVWICEREPVPLAGTRARYVRRSARAM